MIPYPDHRDTIKEFKESLIVKPTKMKSICIRMNTQQNSRTNKPINETYLCSHKGGQGNGRGQSRPK